MKKYICSICGYEYDEAAGDEKTKIPPNTQFEDVPEVWECPLCSAPKIAFEEQKDNNNTPTSQNPSQDENHAEKGLFYSEMSAICSNLAKGCEKQYKLEQAELFNQLADYFKTFDSIISNISLNELREPVQYDLDTYANAFAIAKEDSDRGALRALVWSEKVTKIISSILLRYGKQKDELLEGKNVYVCEICGFIYLGDKPPEVCPVCKVPNFKLKQIKRR